jgi:hypothetical protein
MAPACPATLGEGVKPPTIRSFRVSTTPTICSGCPANFETSRPLRRYLVPSVLSVNMNWLFPARSRTTHPFIVTGLLRSGFSAGREALCGLAGADASVAAAPARTKASR